MEREIVVVLHIYGALAIFLQFCGHQDIESESREMEIGVAGTISTEKKHQRFYGTMISILYTIGEMFYDNYSYTSGARPIFLLFCDDQETESK